MKTLIIIAHGSRRQESTDEIIAMVNNIRTSSGNMYDQITHAFLEICDPSLPDAVKECIDQGAREITVYPFFLNSGNHVQKDIPLMINRLNDKYSDCDIHLLPHFGKSTDITRLILEHVSLNPR